MKIAIIIKLSTKRSLKISKIVPNDEELPCKRATEPSKISKYPDRNNKNIHKY